MNNYSSRNVAIIGAGPAGIFAAKELISKGHNVTLFNRDIKPGGLAEYGIYPTKHKMKDGLRKQFYAIIANEKVSYFGNVTIGESADLTIDEVRSLGFDATLVTIGAQGTNWLGIPGEDLIGSYHAKNIVYHYNQLPPFSTGKYHIGKKVAIIGVGNVMMDIAHYLITDKKVDVVTAIARRGPAEVKFTKKELEYIVKNLDMDDYLVEIEHATPLMNDLGQDPLESVKFIRAAYPNGEDTGSPTIFRIKFLASPVRLIGDENNHVIGMELEGNTLINSNGNIKARGTGNITFLDVDTVIFAVGDAIDQSFGLHYHKNEYITNPQPRFPIHGISYESYNPISQEVVPDVFLGGWARKSSDGLVGNARKDGENAAQAMDMYFQTLNNLSAYDQKTVENKILNKIKKMITKEDLNSLLLEEARIAVENGIPSYKFTSNEEMLEIIEHNRSLVKQPK